jgi:hypothetical protein
MMKYMIMVLMVMMTMAMPFTASAQDADVPVETPVASIVDGDVDGDADVEVLEMLTGVASLTDTDPEATEATEAVAPVATEDLEVLIEQAVAAAQNGQWPAFIGILFTVFLWVIRKFKLLTLIPDGHIGWITILLGALGAMASSLYGGASFAAALTPAVVTALVTTLTWLGVGSKASKPAVTI